MNDAYLSLGSNMGDRMHMLQQAIAMLALTCGDIVITSSFYETAPWGNTNQDAFLNAAVHIRTELPAAALLEGILSVEILLGRQRLQKWGPRTIDIDILYYNDAVINTPNLVVPHPFLHVRRFTLAPLAEIAPGFIHPVLKKTNMQLLRECPDALSVNKIQQ